MRQRRDLRIVHVIQAFGENLDFAGRGRERVVFRILNILLKRDVLRMRTMS